MHCKSLWIKASAKCINVNVNVKWQRYGQEKLTIGVHEAEEACENSASLPVASVNCEGYELQLIHLEGLVSRAVKTLVLERWIPYYGEEVF